MPTTDQGLPYPERTGEPPDVQNDLRLLAEALDPTVAAAAQLRTGQVSISYGGAASASTTITFDPPFTGDGEPVVMVTPTGTQVSPTTIGAAHTISNSGCTILIYSGNQATHAGTRTVSYLAVKP